MERFANSVDPLDRKIDIVKRTFLSIGRIFDREASDTCFGTKTRVFRDPVRIVGVTVFEICVYRNVSGFDQFLYVREHVVARDRAIG